MKHFKKYKDYKVFRDDKMRWQGDTDTEKKVIRVNVKKSKKKSTVIDTVAHELYHARHPKATEKETYKKTPIIVKGLSPAEKKKLYRLVSK